MSRICLDSNVLVAAFASRGLCAEVLRVAVSDHELVVPERVRDEVRRVLREKIKASEEALDAVEAVFGRCEIAAGSSTASPTPVRDPDSSIPILSPRAFLTLVRRGRP